MRSVCLFSFLFIINNILILIMVPVCAIDRARVPLFDCLERTVAFIYREERYCAPSFVFPPCRANVARRGHAVFARARSIRMPIDRYLRIINMTVQYL